MSHCRWTALRDESATEELGTRLLAAKPSDRSKYVGAASGMEMLRTHVMGYIACVQKAILDPLTPSRVRPFPANTAGLPDVAQV